MFNSPSVAVLRFLMVIMIKCDIFKLLLQFDAARFLKVDFLVVDGNIIDGEVHANIFCKSQWYVKLIDGLLSA